MVDLSDKGSLRSDSEEMSSKTPDRDMASSDESQAKTCADCGTTKTPLWRGGPAGPKSLCNACGIRSRKKRRALLGLSNKEERKSKKTSTSSSSGNSSNSNGNINGKLGDSLKRRLMALGREVVLQRPRSSVGKQRRKLGEEEQAAFLLMALSCGSVYA
jgi:hypothetical protein